LDVYDIRNIQYSINNLESKIRETNIMLYNEEQRLEQDENAKVSKDKYLKVLTDMNNELVLLYNTVKEMK